MLQWYEGLLLSALKKRDVRHNEPWKAFISTITQQEYNTFLLPIMDRVIKRAPELIMISIYTLVECLKVDLSMLSSFLEVH